MSQAAGPLNIAVAAALEADDALIQFLGGPHIYSGAKPADVDPADYLVLGQDDSEEQSTFGGYGEASGLTIDGWSNELRMVAGKQVRTVGKGRLLTLVAHVDRVLSGRVLTLDGFGQTVAGKVNLRATIAPNPIDKTWWHAVQRYAALSRRTA